MDYLNSVNNSMTSVVFSDDSIRKDQTMSCINGNGDNESQSDYVPRPATKSNKQKGTTDCKELQVEENDEDVPMTFPQRLMEILATDDLGDVVSWLPHGKGFLIYKKKKFATETLPKYFKQSKFTSFTRKLNRWGFTRVTRGPETGAYYHKMFQRGDLRRCMQMSCQTTTKQTPSMTCNNKAILTVSNDFLPQALSAADLAEQNQNIIRHQLQQLQLQQLQLQQLQFQQQQQHQQLQDAEIMRAHFANKHREEEETSVNPQYFQMYHQLQNMEHEQHLQQYVQQQLSMDDSLTGLKTDANSLFIQNHRSKDVSSILMGGGPVALLPALGAEAFMGPRPPMIEQDGYRSTATGNGRAWAA